LGERARAHTSECVPLAKDESFSRLEALDREHRTGDAVHQQIREIQVGEVHIDDFMF
jgi:hypothetical protein